MRNIIVGTAGHIDHGKSALVEALTGTNPDRLEEEKRRGITIDLGFAFLEHEGVRFGFVDVPGHERFVKNMLAGVGGIDAVLLVVAADESIKPQTREHFDICRLLRIPRGITVITKSDLVDAEQLELVRLEVEELLENSFLAGSPIVGVSAKTGAGLEELKLELVRVSKEVPARDPDRYFRLPVDRVFAMKGFGTVVTGTLLSGRVRAEMEAEIFPKKRRVRIRGVQSGGRAAERADSGQRTALNLAGIGQEELRRGMVLATPGLFEPTTRMDVRLELLSSARALKHRSRVHFHHGTAECIAEVLLLERKQIGSGENGFAQLQLAEAVLSLPGDRFIVRQFSPVVTIGGGVVLDNRAVRHAKKLPHSPAFLEAVERGEKPAILAPLMEVAQHEKLRGGLSILQIVARTGWTPNEARQTSDALVAAGKARWVSEGADAEARVVSSAEFDRCGQGVRAAVEEFHKQNPLLPGIPKEDLRKRVAGHRGEEPLFEAVLADGIRKKELAQSGEVIQRAGRAIALNPEEAQAREQIEEAFAKAGLAAPAAKEVLSKVAVETARAQKILLLLLREQLLIKVAEDLILHRASLEELRGRIADYKRHKGERISVPAFKELAGVSRKYAIPLLEYLDRNGVTRREGDERIIR
jgi:selenocysteine-specific elongation factor